MSDFNGLRVALSGLLAQRRGLEVTSHNIANARTPGYSRQSLDLRSVSGSTVPAFFSKFPGGGFGVRVEDVVRARDMFLETRSYDEHGENALLTAQKAALGQIELLFGEPSDSGIQHQLSDFWAGWDDLANDPGNSAVRSQLVQRGATVAGSIQKAASQIGALRDGAIEQMTTVISQVNVLTKSIAQLNQAIQDSSVSGFEHNDLLDQRDQAIAKLGELVKISIRPADNEMVNVFTDGGNLVSEGMYDTLKIDASDMNIAVRFGKDSLVSNQTTGQLGGLLLVTNGIFPQYGTLLDGVAASLRDQVNALHGYNGGSLVSAIPVSAQDQTGATLSFKVRSDGGAWATVDVTGDDWSGDDGASTLEATLNNQLSGAGASVAATVTGGNGTPLQVTFASIPSGGVVEATEVGKAPSQNAGYGLFMADVPLGSDRIGGRAFFVGTSAATLAVDSSLAANPSRIAASRATGSALDASVALQFARLGEGATSPDTSYRSFIAGLGVDTQTAARRLDIQSASMGNTDQARDAAAGVNIDEEMVSMVQYQQAYQASARMMNAINEALQTLLDLAGR
ncbi:MAG: flagellar hook-associated protein FlgK [Acidimicrobiia bacterium]